VCDAFIHLFAALLGCARAAASKEKNQKSNRSGARRRRQKSRIQVVASWATSLKKRHNFLRKATATASARRHPFFRGEPKRKAPRALDPSLRGAPRGDAVPAACRKSSCTHPRRTICWLIVASAIPAPTTTAKLENQWEDSHSAAAAANNARLNAANDGK